MQPKFTVAFEGPSHTGKSTLIQNLTRRLKANTFIVLPEYAHYLEHFEELPKTPGSSVKEELEGLNFMLSLDQRRWSHVLKVGAHEQLILMNRSVHTILAHRLVLNRITGMPLFEKSCEIASYSPNVLWPALVVFIDTPKEVLSSRYGGHQPKLSTRASAQPPNPLFNTDTYNRIFRSYFVPELMCSNNPVIHLDGTTTIDYLVNQALEIIKSHMGATVTIEG